jgi:plasmid stability protein
MGESKGFIGTYVSPEIKKALQERAAREHRTLSQEITVILTEHLQSHRVPPGWIDRRATDSPQRRRQADPFPRRRNGDLNPPTL